MLKTRKTSSIYNYVSFDNKVISDKTTATYDVINSTNFDDATTTTEDLMKNVLLNATIGYDNNVSEGSKIFSLIKMLTNISYSTMQPKTTHKSFTTDKVKTTSKTVKSEFFMVKMF